MKLEGWIAYWPDEPPHWFGSNNEGEVDDEIKKLLEENRDMVIPLKRKITITITIPDEEPEAQDG